MSIRPGPDPRVSVLVAARDAGATLSVALESVRRQTLADWECIVVDDGSRDPARVPDDPRFRLLWISPEGPAEARNRALRLSRGEYVAVLDADDVMRAQRLESQVEALEAHPEWAGVGCHVRYFPRAGMGEGMGRYETWLNSMTGPQQVRRDGWVEMPVGHPTLMLRTELLRDLGGWRDQGWPEDWDLFLRLVFERELEIGLVPRRLLAWRVRDDSLSRTGDSYSTEAFQRCRAAFLARSFLQDSPTYTLWGYGSTGRTLARELRRHGKRFSHLVEIHPRRLGQEIQGAPVVSPSALDRLRPERLIVSVAGAESRAMIRAELSDMGFCEGRDFICAA